MNVKTKLFASVAIVRAAAFDPGTPGWKKDADGKLAMDDKGNPIYVDASGREISTDHSTISRLNAEAATHRTAKETAEAALAKYKNITDPEAALKAIEAMSKIDQKKLIDSGEVDRVKADIKAQYEAQLTEANGSVASLTEKNAALTRAKAFASSKFIAEKIAVPAEMFEATFGGNFKIEGDALVPYGRDGNKIYSKKRMGEVADVDEAFEILVDNYPHKDSILKANGQQGSGNGGGGGNRPSGRTVKRADFDAMSPMDKAATATAMQKGEAAIVD